MPGRNEEIKALVQRIGGIGELGDEDDFFEAGFESVNALELLLELESTYSVTISDDAFVQCRTVRSIADMLKSMNDGGQVS